MAPARRARKATVDYSVLNGKRKRSIQSQVKDTRGRRKRASQVSPDVEMIDGTQDPVLDCALNQLTAQCADNPEALQYFRTQLLRDPPVPRGVFIFLTDLMRRRLDFLALFFDKQWTLSEGGIMCNRMGHPLTYEVGEACGDEVLYDALEFSVPSRSPPDTSNPGPLAGSSSLVDSSLNPAVLEAENRRLNALPQDCGLFTISDAPIPKRAVAGGSATLARMAAQMSSQGLITSYFRTRHAGSSSLLPAAQIVEPPRPGGRSVHHIPTSTEQARQEASSQSPAPAIVPLGSADVDLDDDATATDTDEDEDSDDATDDQARQRPRISDLDEDMRPLAITACEVLRVLVVTRDAFPDQIKRAMFRQEAWTRAWKAHNRVGEPPLMTSSIRRLLDQRPAQVRGELKVAARAMVVQGFGLNGLTPTEKTAKVLTLIGETMFQLHYENIDQRGIGSGRKFMNPCIVELLVQVMFKGGANSDGYRYFYLFNPITSNIMALMIVSLMVALQEHSSGNARVNVPFRETDFRPIFMRVKATIESYRDQRRDRYDGIRQSILASCRTAAGVIEPTNLSGHLLQLALSP